MKSQMFTIVSLFCLFSSFSFGENSLLPQMATVDSTVSVFPNNNSSEDRIGPILANSFFGEIICAELGFVGSFSWGNQFNGYLTGVCGTVTFLAPAKFVFASDGKTITQIIHESLVSSIAGSTMIAFSYYSFNFDREKNQGRRFLNSFFGYSLIALPAIVLDGLLSEKPFRFM